MGTDMYKIGISQNLEGRLSAYPPHTLLEAVESPHASRVEAQP